MKIKSYTLLRASKTYYFHLFSTNVTYMADTYTYLLVLKMIFVSNIFIINQVLHENNL